MARAAISIASPEIGTAGGLYGDEAVVAAVAGAVVAGAEGLADTGGVKGLLGAVALAGFSLPAYADTTLTIATVNNGNMIDMQKLTDDFTNANPDIKLNWVTLE